MRRTYTYVGMTKDEAQRSPSALLRAASLSSGRWTFYEAVKFVWGKISKKYLKMGSFKFSKMLIKKAKVAASPGIGFGEYGDDYVRFVLVENAHRTRQAIRGIRNIM